jgi:hypothetical protein
MLDAASYSLSMESKKAFSQELAGISGIRSAITVFARVEAAHGVLNDNLRMLLTGFLRLTETGAPEGDVFPEFTEKLERHCSFASSFGNSLYSPLGRKRPHRRSDRKAANRTRFISANAAQLSFL